MLKERGMKREKKIKHLEICEEYEVRNKRLHSIFEKLLSALISDHWDA